MFVPLHHRRLHRTDRKPVPPGRVAAMLAAVAAALATGLVGALLDKKGADTGDWVVMGVVIAVAAVGGGFALAKIIGRQGKI